MRNVVCVLSIAVIVAGLALAFLVNNTEPVGATMQSTGEVRAMQCDVIGEDDNIMVLKDEHNNLWLLDAGELDENDVVCVWFDDMGTPKDLTDDEILDYCEVIED